MRELRIDRRRLLKLGLSAGALGALPLACLRVGQNDVAALLEFVGNSDRPTQPERTGVLSEDAFEVLSSLSRYVDQAWELGADMALYRDRLHADLRFKTSEVPSYLTEYESAVGLFHRVAARTAEVEQVWASLLFSEVEAADLASTRLGRARRFVFSELITHQVPMSEAFRSFGLWNYRGYFGGSYMAPESYRRGAD